MNLKIIGSGGCTSIPTPTCNCAVCKQAKEKGFPYSRTGCSLFIKDIKFLIDTPEDIKWGLINSKIDKINGISISHSDPDHTRGIRIIEEMNINWLDTSKSKKVNMYLLPEVYEDINKWLFNTLNYFENKINVINKKLTNKFAINDVQITMVHNFPILEGKRKANICIYVIEQGDKKVIYAPCDCKPLYDNELFYNADLLIMGCVIPSNIIKNNEKLDKDHELLKTEVHTLSAVKDIKNKYNIKKVIVTHIEELWGKSFDDYKILEKDLDNIKFAYDGMDINL